MRQRVISALVGLLILVVVFIFLDTPLFNVVITLISVIAVVELLQATGCTGHRGLTVFAVLIALVIPFARESYVRPILPQLLFALVMVFFLLLLKNHAVVRVEQAAMTFMFAIFVPIFFGCAVYLRDDFGTTVGSFYLLWALGSAWLCDTGAYFCGLRFGRHKLAPVVSPKKTVEGAIGGLIFAAVFMLLIARAYSALMPPVFEEVLHIRYGLVALLTPVFSAIGILGDLSASIIKRQFNVKDYGHIMPGHGGVMDRFDSVLFTLPAIYIAVHYIRVADCVALGA